MPKWKLNIFVNAIRTRILKEERTAEDIVVEYVKLTEEECTEILAAIE